MDPKTERRLDAITDACRTDLPADRLFPEIATRLQGVLGFDGASWFATDPTTVLPTAPALIENIDSGHCDTFWDREARVEDAHLFRDLSRSQEGLGTLYAATEDRPARSTRFREFLDPQGYGDELRAAFRVGQTTWGVVALHRDRSRKPFDAQDLEVIRRLSPVVAMALRSIAVAARSSRRPADGDGPATALFDSSDNLLSLDERAERLFAEMAGPGWASWGHATTPVFGVLARARAVAAGTEARAAVARVRAASGRWLALHASQLRGTDARPGPLALTIEPCQSSQLAPIIVEAYSLTEREQEITRAVARGLSNPEIAGELFLSPHTVRDHLKAVFAKVGVGSRGELVAKLFADHYAPALHAPGAPVAHVER
jgi:DNA-binding CsgD family transcriptional regulator